MDNSVSTPHEVAEKDRLARERRDIARALDQVAAGHVVSIDDVDAWIESLDTDRELPIPFAGR